MSRLTDTTEHWRARLIAREQDAVRRLITDHTATVQRIQPTLDRVLAQYTDALKSGEKPSPSWLYEADRLKRIQALLQQDMDAYGTTARTVTRDLVADAASLGMDGALDQLHAATPSDVTWAWGRPSVTAIHEAQGMTSAGSPLADLFGSFGPQAARDAKQALVTGVSIGSHPSVIARNLKAATDMPLARARTIARTEALRSYRRAATATYKANRDVLDGWIWQADLGSACGACTAMHGTRHDVGEDMSSHPNCRCVQVPLTKDWGDILGHYGVDASDLPDTRPDIESGDDWFAAQPATVQDRILGTAKASAYRDGQFDLSDLVGRSHSADWGTSIYEKSLRDLGIDPDD